MISNYFDEILIDYENAIDQFFDNSHGAVLEPGRDDGTPRFLFTEVTGYAILDFLLLYNITGNNIYLNKAQKCAEWITNHAQYQGSGVLTRYYFQHDERPDLIETSFHGKKIFAFDTAICLKGLVALYSHTKNKRYLTSALEMGMFLVDKMVEDDGFVCAVYDAENSLAVEENAAKWSNRFGAFHSKVGEALIDLYSETNDDIFLNKSQSICRRLLMFQSTQGNFETSSGVTELHPHCYAAEGLLHVGVKTDNSSFVEAAKLATEWALRQCKDGEIPQKVDFNTCSPLARFRTDALAQTLALSIDLHNIDMLDGNYKGKLKELSAKLIKMKSETQKYFRYGYYEKKVRGKYESNSLSYWTNMFCFRSLYKYYCLRLLDETYFIILAGGTGTRVWPISCETLPKPLSTSLLVDRSLMQETIRRYTFGGLIKPDRVFLVCGKKGIKEAIAQAEKEGIPKENIVEEIDPKGTIPALCLGLEVIRKKSKVKNRLIVVSMADNVIEPYVNFQGALMSGLFVGSENDCIVSIGKSIEKGQKFDKRFGHMLCKEKIDPYSVYKVDRFEEKPEQRIFDELVCLDGNLAWEGGTIVFRESYFDKFSDDLPQPGNLAEHFLARATEWTTDKPNELKLAVSVFSPETRFEDFGFPGSNLKKFYKNDKRYRFHNNNICLGSSENFILLGSSNNLVISDNMPIELYGLDGYLIINNDWTKASVILPMDEVDHLPSIYWLLSIPEKYRPYIVGGVEAKNAMPVQFSEENTDVRITCDAGLVFAYRCKDNLSIHRTKNKLCVMNREYPNLDTIDFNILRKKEEEDTRLVQHLFHVTRLSESVVGGDLLLSSEARRVLKLFCLYHDIGGYLTRRKTSSEEQAKRRFIKATNLDFRMIDSLIIHEYLMLEGASVSVPIENMVGLNDDINSAVVFLREREIEDKNIRDIIVGLLQSQDSPHLFTFFRKNFARMGFDRLEGELESIFACLKICEIVANGRWMWKRIFSSTDPNYKGFLEYINRGLLEDFAFMVTFIVKTLQKNSINPYIFVNRLNEVINDETSLFNKLILELQGCNSPLVCDEVYVSLMRSKKIAEDEVRELIVTGISRIKSQEKDLYQLGQIIEFPSHLEKIEPHCDIIRKDCVSSVRGIIEEIYHENHKLFKRHVHHKEINRLLDDSFSHPS